MSNPVRVFEARDALDLARAKAILEAEGIAYVVEGENYAVAAGGWAFGGDATVHLLVQRELAARARGLLEEAESSAESDQSGH